MRNRAPLKEGQILSRAISSDSTGSGHKVESKPKKNYEAWLMGTKYFPLPEKISVGEEENDGSFSFFFFLFSFFFPFFFFSFPFFFSFALYSVCVRHALNWKMPSFLISGGWKQKIFWFWRGKRRKMWNTVDFFLSRSWMLWYTEDKKKKKKLQDCGLDPNLFLFFFFF